MHPGALTKLGIVALVLVFSPHIAISQETPTSGEVVSFLRLASAQLPNIDKNQQPSMAANIAGAQASAGDLDGALSTVRAVESEDGRVFATGSVASVLAWKGNVEAAVDLIQKSAVGHEPEKANAYHFVAQQRASRHAFEESLKVAQLIADGPGFFGKTNRLTETLMEIQTKQWEAGDLVGAKSTLNLALDAVEREIDHPFTREFADTMPADEYGGIANVLSREGNRTDALAVLDRVYAMVPAARTPETRQHLSYILAIAQVNLGEIQAAVSGAEQLPPGQWRDAALLAIVRERTRLGDPLGALDEAAGLSSEFLRNSSFLRIANALAGSGNYTRALSTIDGIQSEGERAYALSDIALEQAEKGDPAAALTVELASELALKAGNETKPSVFGLIALTRGMLDDFSGAEATISHMDDGARVWPLQNLTGMLVRAGRETEAISLAESQTAPHPKASALLGIATALADQQREAAKIAEGAR
jgi:tetratricopeptide (TPR) repeat protein